MATINVQWSRLHEQGLDPQALMRHQQAWEKAGYKVYVQVQDQKDLTVLQKMTEPPHHALQSNAYQLACLFLLGIVTTIITAVWLGLLR